MYEAGHEVPAYQPQTAYEIFRRTIGNLDIATGKESTANNPVYSTSGPSSTWQFKNKGPAQPKTTCYMLSLGSTCRDDQIQAVMHGSALVHDWVLIDANTSSLFPGVSGGNETADAVALKH